MTNLLKRGAALAAAGSFGIGAMAKASWDQVDAVQQATVALGAYEKNGSKVSKVLSDLVKYAKSDMGVLFQRQDLFAAAQNLKIMGDNTGELTKHVEIMSRSVGLGLSNWDDLDQIIGRVGSTGRLTGNDFDLLKARGFKLDDSLRNTNVTWGKLFKALDKGIPANALAGQAETIRGKSIRLQSAFRDLGNEFLGVDSATSQFTKGGLGDTLANSLDQLITFLKTPEMKEGLKKLGDDVSKFMKQAEPLIQHVLLWLVNNMGTVINGFIVFGSTLAAIKMVRFASDTAGAVSQIISLSKESGKTVSSIARGFGSITSGTIPAVKKAFTLLKSQVGTPMSMPAIAVGAAVAAIALVIQKYNEMKSAVERANNTYGETQKVIKNTNSAMKKALENGKISKKQYDSYVSQMNKATTQTNQQIRSQYSGTFGWLNMQLDKLTGSPTYKKYEKAMSKSGGGGWATGGFTGRGGVNEVAGLVHRGEYVIPQKDVDQATGLPKVTPTASGGARQVVINIKHAEYHNDADMARFARQIGGQLA